MSNKSKTPWRESSTLRKNYSANDLKSVSDLSATEMDLYFERQQSKMEEENRLTGSYIPKVSMEEFQL